MKNLLKLNKLNGDWAQSPIPNPQTPSPGKNNIYLNN